MRKFTVLAAASLIALPLTSIAKAADDGKVFYDKGINVAAGGTSLRINEEMITSVSYQDYDKSESRGLEDKTSFDIQKWRLELNGKVMDGDVAFKLQNDFIGGTSSDGKKTSDLKDAWFQFNSSKEAMFRMGQFKVPYSLQQLVGDTNQQMLSRSIVDQFALGRKAGAMLQGEIADGVNYYLNVSNGESAGEGLNRSGLDTDLLGAGMLTYVSNYDRSYEGDVHTTEGVGYTAGIAVTYGSTPTTDMTRVGGDLGVRSDGMSLQGEFHYLNTDPDGADSTDDIGYYVQAGYFLVPQEWELAGRFAAINPDSKSGDPDRQEYSVAVNYFLMGQALKIQTGVTFENTNPDVGDTTTDSRYQMQVVGFL